MDVDEALRYADMGDEMPLMLTDQIAAIVTDGLETHQFQIWEFDK